MKKILVTGGAGFIGSNLCAKLIKENHHVTCIDNLSTGKLDNISKLIKSDKFEFINHDIIFKFETRNRFDEIYNLACPASPPSYQKDPVQTLKTCILGTINILELAKKCNSKILQASTSEIYGDPLEHPQNENYWGNVNPVGLRSCYDEGKRCSETLFIDYHRKYNINIKIVRIFNTYGPMMDKNDGRVISNFINQAINSKNLTIYGDGNQTRSFMYVSDLIDGITRAMQTDYPFPINLGNPNEINMNNLANIILEYTKSNSKKIYKKLPSDDPKRRKPNIQLAKKILKWEPKVTFKNGLIKTIDYYKKNNE